MDAIEQYRFSVIDVIEKIAYEQKKNIEKAAYLIADTIESGKVFHVVGSGGHSNMVSSEMCHRAGMLMPVNVMLDPGLGCEHGATRWCEKIPGYGQNVLRYYGVKTNDVLILCNAYGLNTVTIDMAHECRRLGVTIIAITSPKLSKNIPEDFKGRSPYKENLCDLADIVIDDYCIYGEGVVGIDGYDYKVSPTSTITNMFIINCINAKTCEILAERGIAPPVWISGNIPGGTEINQAGMDVYFGKLRHL